MAEEVGDGPDIHASPDELRGGEVSQVVQAHVWCANLIPDTNEKRRHVVGSEWGPGFNKGGENKRIGGKLASSLGDPGIDVYSMSSQEGNANRVKSDLPGAIRLGGLLGEPTLNDDDGAGDFDDTTGEIDIGPTERTQLASAHPRERSKHEERSEPRIPPLCLLDDVSDDIDRWRLHSAMGNPRGLCLFGDVRADPSPAHALVEGCGDDGVVIPDRLGGLASVLHGAVQVVQVTSGELAELQLAEPRTDGLRDLRLVVTDRRWGEVEPLTLFEPAVEELTNCRSDAVSPAWGLLVHEVTKCSVRCS